MLTGLLIRYQPNNILVNYEEAAGCGNVTVNNVQISDLEDAVILPSGKWLRGPLCGNAMWRRPESWCRSRQNYASDVFSFGIVMIYVILNEMIFRVDEGRLKASDSWRDVLSLHISYFADEDGLGSLLEHIRADNPFYGRLIDLAHSFGPEIPECLSDIGTMQKKTLET
ncbi:predicted protein [Paecilomyces variotii No. 5]|uniref:Protein kinase domain-containing protein n=1 Tax=Byssochlamys spectabilis (strain No. 5 / NBRC 109023) TaxID=1356009 RepID=V5FM81_BYSSN|nr:predicted protein [Paecilomyces variotii No. 5]